MVKLEKIVNNLPEISLYSKSRMASMQRQYKRSNLNLKLGSLITALLLATIILSAIVFFMTDLFFSDLLFSIGITLIVFSAGLLTIQKMPSLCAKRYATKVEADLPAALRSISLHLQINLPFEKALDHISRSDYSCKEPFLNIVHSINSGGSIPKSLSDSALSIDSIHYARAMQTLSQIYETGQRPDALDSLSDDLINQQQIELKLHSSRAALFSLVFVAISCLIPAFFLILTVAAGPILKFDVDGYSIGSFYILILPAFIIFTLFSMLLFSPTLKNNIDQERLLFMIRNDMRKKRLPVIFETRLVLYSLILASVTYLLSSILFSQYAALISLIIASVPFLYHSYFESIIHSKISSLESELPTVLMMGASTEHFSLEKMLQTGAKSSSVLLAEQCKESLGQIKAGTDPQTVLKNWMQRTPSLVLRRSLVLLSIGYSTGSKMHKALRISANDLLSSFTLIRERSSLLSIQRYTILAAAAILVPAILAVSLDFSSQIASINLDMDSGLMDDDGMRMPMFDSSKTGILIDAAKSSIPLYLILNSILASFYISISQGERQRFFYYSLLIAIVSQGVWLIL